MGYFRAWADNISAPSGVRQRLARKKARRRKLGDRVVIGGGRGLS